MNLSGEAWAQIAKEEQDTQTQQAGHLDTVRDILGRCGSVHQTYSHTRMAEVQLMPLYSTASTSLLHDVSSNRIYP